MVNVKKGRRFIPKTVSCILNQKNQLIVPNKELTNEELSIYASCMKIPFFRGVFMKDALPEKMWENETGIVNLDDSDGSGTHWVCYKKLGEHIYYFDSFGDLPPPKELQHYFHMAKEVRYNYDREQPDETSICGHLCLDFLARSVSHL